MSQSRRRPSHSNNFNLLRLSLALLVIFSHCFPLTSGSNVREPLFVFSQGRLTFGQLAVALFFVISGYLVTESWQRQPRPSAFLRKRWLRIFPGYLVVAAICIAVIAPLAAGGFGAHQFVLIQQTAEMEPLISPVGFAASPYPGTINGSLWTIRYELYCYVLLAAAGLMGMLRTCWAVLPVLAGALALSAANALWPFSEQPIRLFGKLSDWPAFLSFFMAGVALCNYRDVIRRSLPLFVTSLICGGAMLRSGRATPIALALPVLAGYWVFFIAFANTPRLHGLCGKADFSYGTYLYAFPVQQMIVWLCGIRGPLGLFAIAAPITLAFAAASWYLVEQPFLRRKLAVIPEKPEKAVSTSTITPASHVSRAAA